MSFEQHVSEIIAQYKKHGWTLSRILLTPASRSTIDDEFFGGAKILDSRFDAAWFTRSTRPGHVTWELRALSGTPFALLEVIDDNVDDVSREERLRSVENRLADTLPRHRGN